MGKPGKSDPVLWVPVWVAIITTVGLVVVALVTHLIPHFWPSTVVVVPPQAPASAPISAAVASAQKPKLKVVLIDSRSRAKTLELMRRELSSLSDLDISDKPQDHDWLSQASILAADKPSLVVVHWHTWRTFVDAPESGEDRDRRAEEELLRGLHEIFSSSPNTNFVLYSSAFAKQPEHSSLRDIERAVGRTAVGDPARVAAYSAMATRFTVLPWPDAPSSNDRIVLREMVRRLAK